MIWYSINISRYYHVENSYLHFYFRILWWIEVQKNSIYLKSKACLTLNTTVQKFGVSNNFYFKFWGKEIKNINNFIRQVTVQKVTYFRYSISNKCCSLQPSKIPEKTATQLFLTLIIIMNIFWASNHHFRIISEGSCDTKDSNDDENSACINRLLQTIQDLKIVVILIVLWTYLIWVHWIYIA